MITGYAFAVTLCVLVVGLLFGLLRTRRIREKYAGIWIVVSVGVLVLAVFPRFAFWLAKLAGVSTPVNLLFAVSIAVLLTVCIQLSIETSALEEETRTIAEELALLRLEVRAVREDRFEVRANREDPFEVTANREDPFEVPVARPDGFEAPTAREDALQGPVAREATAYPVPIPEARAAFPSD